MIFSHHIYNTLRTKKYILEEYIQEDFLSEEKRLAYTKELNTIKKTLLDYKKSHAGHLENLV
jgi:hypothetical protein